jgi:hypothetical protein
MCFEDRSKTKIVKTEATSDHVQVTLENGVTCYISTNKGYLHVHLSNIDVEKPIKVENVAANQFDVRYAPTS